LPRLIDLDAAAHSYKGEGYNGNVIYLSTYSKTLAPALRVGVIVAAAPLMRKLVQAKQGGDLHTATLNQMIAYELDKAGFLDGQARKVAAVYRERRDVMLAALREYFPAEMECSSPEGGMFLWLKLPARYDTQELLQRALEKRVAFVPGTSFFADGTGKNTMRLNFSNSTPEVIREGVRRLAELL
ncbi:unnamed protein product, partial [Phaeothamnion confervicola]